MDKKNLEIVRKFKEKASKNISIKKLILFGSRAKGKTHKWSDFDIIVVSDNFKGKISFKRCPKLYDYWEENYPVDFLCYTPEEFNKLKNKVTIVREAVRKGIEI
jgi:hypothetical protein